MATPIAYSDSTGWRIEANRLAIREVLQSRQIIERIHVGWDGQIKVRAVDWHEVWGGAVGYLVPEQLRQLQSLRACRESYITRGFEQTSEADRH